MFYLFSPKSSQLLYSLVFYSFLPINQVTQPKDISDFLRLEKKNA